MSELEPNAELARVAPNGVVQLNDAPSGLDDGGFDSLFPAESNAPVNAAPQAQQPQQVQQPQPQVPPQTPQADASFFLKGEKSVYKTAEAAIEGLNSKDALIEQLRQRYALTTGMDPITGQPVGQPQVPQVVDDYSTNPNRYMTDLVNAAKTGRPEDYTAVQQKLIRDSLKDYLPTLQHTAVEQARAKATSELPAIGTFVGSEAYTKTLNAVPELKEAISLGEADARFAGKLPGLYKIAYLASQGMQLPEILTAQQTVQQSQQPQTPTQKTQVIRTTTAPTTQNIPVQTVSPNLRSLAGIRATIADAEARGIKLDW